MLRRLLIANRGEIALRVTRAASELGIKTVSIFERADESSLHVHSADAAVCVDSYMDSGAIMRAAIDLECDALHPGYGFLSESAYMVKQCEEAGVAFVGPTAATIEQLGDKVAARGLAQSLGIPVGLASDGACANADEVRRAMSQHGMSFPVMLKAVGGGGGRGMRPCLSDDALESTFQTCAREAELSGAAGGVFVEELMEDARHIEVQLLGDGQGGLIHLFERDCSVQRRRQKLLETAPALGLDDATRSRLYEHALAIGHACNYRSAGTCEFLLSPGGAERFLEFNPRIQVEHTVSEEATGIDLVQAQLMVASGATLDGIGLRQSAVTLRNAAIQARVQMTSPGQVTAFAEPGGPGLRVDGSLFAGYTPSTRYDPLLTKMIARASSSAMGGSAFETARRRLLRACSELHIGGSVQTNLAELRRLLQSTAFAQGEWTTGTLDEWDRQAQQQQQQQQQQVEEDEDELARAASRAALLESSFAPMMANDTPGARGAAAGGVGGEEEVPPPDGCSYVRSPAQGLVLEASDAAAKGAAVSHGSTVLVLSSMKMEVVVPAPEEGTLLELLVKPGAHVEPGQPVALLRHASSGQEGAAASPSLEASSSATSIDLDAPPRADLARMLERRRQISDEGRLEDDSKFRERVKSRHAKGQRTARENISALVDDGSFFEYGRFAVAAQSKRRSLEELQRRTPADGLVGGVGSVNGDLIASELMRKAVVVSYDATVLAGTQGAFNHMKLDRMLALSEQQRLPLVLMAEGGGGRPGDVDVDPIVNSMLAVHTFSQMGRLSGLVPLVGVASGFCFAGNAALLGACDVVIATEGSNIGMAGPAMVEGGGLGKVAPKAIGPVAEQFRNGVVDLVARDDTEACELARRYLSYFQGPTKAAMDAADQRRLRSIVPENRKRLYEMREVVETLVDHDSFLELRRGFGEGIITGLVRIDGRPLGVLANSPSHLGGAVDSDGALKASRFMELMDAFGLPLLLLCDTPGFMVGPESEQAAAVRKMARLFAVGSSLSVPFFTIVLRKAYGLGAMAMAGGMSVGPNVFHASWPSAEAGPMNLEGAVELGFAKELATAGAMPLVGASARKALFDKILSKGYERAGALSVARTLETDDVIDPAESRAWVIHALDSAAVEGGGGVGAEDSTTASWRRRDTPKRRPCVSPW